MRQRPWSDPTILPLSVLLCAISCSDSPSTPDTPAVPVATAINLSTNTASFSYLGQTLQVSAVVTDQNGAPLSAPVSWSVDAPAVATVSSSGVITAAGNGATTVRASRGSVGASVSVTVQQQATTLTVSSSSVTLIGVGSSQAVTAAARDAGGQAVGGAVITWRSSNEAVVTVSSSGTISAVSLGSATITAQSGTLTAPISVTVTAPTLNIPTPRGMDDMIRGLNLRFALSAFARNGQGQDIPAPGTRWSSSNPSVATIDSLTGQVLTLAAGRVTFIARSADGGTGAWTRDVVRIRRMQIDPYLATPLAGALWEIPVILLEYHPTADGFGLDTLRVPDFGAANWMSLDSLQRLTMRFAKRRKMMVEHGSRFRGYSNPAAPPSLGYRVIEHIIVYDQIPPHPTKRQMQIPGNPRFEDWHTAISDVNLEPLMRAQRVRELWVAWASFDGNYPVYNPARHKVEDMRAGWESNMSSPTGDVSNSDRDRNDAPVLDHTYIIYGINFRRTQAEAVHNVGHQLEAMLSHINSRQDGNQFLFWRSFVGQNASNQFISGRAGWTHMPPNTTVGYDYLNTTPVSSDIQDWRPDNTGAKTQVNASTWGNLVYPWPGETNFAQRVESQWYTYWFQNFPGRGNQIRHGGNWMTNWWAFVADWDAALRSGLGLYGSSPAAQTGSRPYAFPEAGARAAPVGHHQ